jgi:hypothetical protein
MNRLDKWRKQREEIARDVRRAVEAGQSVLAELGQDAGRKLAFASAGRRRGGRRKGSKMSKAARAKISAAQRARWAKRRREQRQT